MELMQEDLRVTRDCFLFSCDILPYKVKGNYATV